MDLFLDTLYARNKQRAANFSQSEEAMSRVTASAMSFQEHDSQLIFAGTVDSFVTVLWSTPMP